MTGTTRIVLAAALLALGICSGTSLAAPPPKGGTSVTLTLANPEPRDRPSSQIAEAFAAKVRALSNGKVLVKVIDEAGRTSENTPVGQVESNLIGLVRSGKAQLAIVPTRAFAAQGVTSFQALQAPFLITSDAAMAKVTTGDIAARLQSGVDKIGLTGLGLAPEGLRRAFGFEHALVTPADFKGIKIRSIPSKQTWALLRTLGAKPVDLNGDDFDHAVAAGSVKGAESSLALAAFGFPVPSITAGNIAFFPKMDALVGNVAALAALDGDQVAALRQAGSAARAWALRSLTEKAARNAFCKAGGTVVTAPASSIKALRAKVEPMLAVLRKDALTRSLMAEMSKFRGSGSTLAPCSHGGAGQTATKLIPAGVYRYVVTEKEVLAAGATREQARAETGTVTVTITADGYQQIRWASPYPEWNGPCDKRKMYIRNGLVIMELRGNHGACGGYYGLAWKHVPEGLIITRAGPDAYLRYLVGKIWRKIG